MSEREYIVTLKKGVDCADFHNTMCSSTGDQFVPNRSIGVTNARPGSQRNTHYSLTDQEADQLRQDSRVEAVEIPPEQREDIFLAPRAIQQSDFTKTTSDSGAFVNWGLRRCNEATDPYDGTTVTGAYTYTLDGTGVDVVIQDSGIQADHPEFEDNSGVSRVQQIDWYTASGLSGTQDENFYTDYDGHGTHCAGIAAGKTYGWAKNSKIYAQKLAGLEGTADPNSGIAISDAFDTIKEWHNNKPVDPDTGFKRPTVVNMSWGYGTYYNTVSSISYRGVTYTGADIDTQSKRWSYGLVPISGSPVASYITNVRIPSVDADIQEMIDAGIHVFIAAGNRAHKVESFLATDYDNSAVTNTGTKFYHRGSSPYDDEAFIVGNIDSSTHVSEIEQKSSSSETGPGVNIYAPGTNIMSCTSNTNKFADGVYPQDSGYRICNISGTSMAAPQVCGISACYLQLNPGVSPAQLRSRIISNTGQTGQIFQTGLNNDYTDQRSLLGGNNVFVFNPFTRSSVFTITKG